MSLFAELRRRNVFRVGIAYVVASWLLLQLTEVLTELLELSTDIGKMVIILLIIGFVPALIFAWAFEMTPEGLKREREVDRNQSITPQTGRKLDRIIIGMLVLIAAYFIWESRFMGRPLEEGPEPVAQPSSSPAGTAGEMPMAPTPVSENTGERKSIVVLPFINMSNDPDQEFFSDGLSEEILNALVKIRDLRVISRTSAFAFKGKDVSIPEIAAQLGVSYVLEGSVRKAGNDVRITAQLIEVETDSHLWSDAYNRSLQNVFEIQEEISVAIAEQLQVTLGEGAEQARPTENIEAYQMFLRGRHLYQDRGEENLVRAVQVLKDTVELDPEFADAWANLAGASTVRAFQLDEGHEAMFEQGRQAAERAIAIDPQHGFGHGVLGLLLLRQLRWEESGEMLDRAIALNPYESNSLLWKGIFLTTLGYTEDALEIFKRAEALDPVWPLLQQWKSSAFLSAGDFVALEALAERSEQLDWGFNSDLNIELYLHHGDLDSAETTWAESDREDLGTDVLVRATMAALRDPGQSRQSVETLLANADAASYFTLFSYLWRIGATGEGLAELDRQIAVDRGLRVVTAFVDIWNASNRPNLAAPELPEFLQRIGMADYWRRHGNPDHCRVDGHDIECGAP